ncbi:DUF1616 domain-containing protein [Halobellus sp. GM3]|uniref:DUF1616 domain-containing protein n=1 Tax=Halobellus sp. GM3 TaxID=3458410 RepID=UPI00403E2C05
MGSDGARLSVDHTAVVAIPFDLLAAGVLSGAAFLLVTLGISGPLRVVAGAVLLWFLPGYVTVAALFPRRGTGAAESESGGERLSLRSRALLAVATSLALSIVAGLALGTVAAGFTPDLVLYATIGYVAAVGLLASVRRYQVPRRERFSLPVETWVDEALAAGTTGSRVNRALTLGLICSVLVAVGAFGFAVGAETPGQTYTDFHLVTSDDDGGYVSTGYPDELNESDPATLSWGIRNAEATDTEYTVVVELERVVESGGEMRVIESDELNRTSVSTAAGERAVRTHTVRPTLVGENLRLGFYLYRGDAPDRAGAETAYRHLHLWVTVTPTP